jgi:hypothetical protein
MRNHIVCTKPKRGGFTKMSTKNSVANASDFGAYSRIYASFNYYSKIDENEQCTKREKATVQMVH